MRTLLLELRPTALKDASFSELIKQLSEALSGRTRIPVEVEFDEFPEIEEELKIALYRIAQEAFNNIAKHANANLVKVTLKRNHENYILKITDDGKGMTEINIPSNHLGINIMKERAEAIDAVLEIDSKPGVGTTVSVKWKVKSD